MASTNDDSRFRFSIDRGGTFTDVFAEVIDNAGGVEYMTLKLLSDDPANYADAPTEGIRRILQEVTRKPFPRGHPVNTMQIDSIRMGTTVATNALLERKGERAALFVTKGFRDLLLIGNQTRSDIFALNIERPDLLYEVVVEVDEDVILPVGDAPSTRNGSKPGTNGTPGGELRETKTGETVCVRKAVDADAVRLALRRVQEQGISSLAVVLKHAAIFPDHELAVGRLAQELGFAQVSLSSQVSPMVKMVPRGFTASADAYLTPHIKRYLRAFQSGFDDNLANVELSFMQSDGGLSPLATFSGHKAVLSGPAGGYVGYAQTTRWDDMPPGAQQVIGFDMGGTSTDVSRFDGVYEHVLESTTAGVTIQAPQLDINTVAAGGGSRLFFRNGVFSVGPESAGAHPGPVCYRKSGHLAVTDVNLALGRILPEFFPAIFGPDEDQPLDLQGSWAALQALTDEVNQHGASHGLPAKTVDDVALGFVAVANEAMCRPIRALTEMRGYDVQSHVLACFGGAGGQHACAIARQLGMRTVFVHRFASILSAVGMGLASIVQEAQEPAACALDRQSLPHLLDRLEALAAQASAALTTRGFAAEQITVERFLNLRFQGTDVAIMVLVEADDGIEAAFMQRYQREFGFVLKGRDILVDDVRVRASGSGSTLPDAQRTPSDPGPLPEPDVRTRTCFEQGGRLPTAVYTLDRLSPGHVVPGPALLINKITTIVVEPGCAAHVTAAGDVRIEVSAAKDKHAINPDECDPVLLAIFSHRFMSIAEQMGRSLQRSSISVNIKERLDFSCALFGPTGDLVANAPHLPVHLGAMSEAVRAQISYYRDGEGADDGLHEGDVLVTNHPQLAGGSHLPDITVITPVYDGGRVVFYVASRGHHADVGGISPGSMPPHSKRLVEEGATIVSFKLVRDGVFQEEGVTQLLRAPASLGIEGVVGTRCLFDNLSDLRAQVAANTKGIALVRGLIQEYSLRVVQAYMAHIQANAEHAVRAMLSEFSTRQGLEEVGTVSAEDQMDDGTKIKLAVTIDRRDGSATFDFAGTGPEVYGNTNAPPAVTYSAVIYSLRCMLSQDIPLNSGCLAPVLIKVPERSILHPSPGAAVVGGNVLTSQRLTDVVLRAFSALACSYGCMNNFTFGDEQMGYYETIGGGYGAGPDFDGCSGVQAHMTNTRITDPEILERHYPVSLRHFGLRAGSGGGGRRRGGDGIERTLEFLRPLQVGILSERRSVAPRGILGGSDAEPGLNLWLRGAEGHVVNLGGKATVRVEAGDCISILTPGGGGYGHHDAAGEDDARTKPTHRKTLVRDSGSLSEWKRRSESS